MSSENINGVYIPAALIVIGTTIIKSDWVPYAAAVATALGAWKLMGNSKKFPFLHRSEDQPLNAS